jgi:hypothetical protein
LASGSFVFDGKSSTVVRAADVAAVTFNFANNRLCIVKVLTNFTSDNGQGLILQDIVLTSAESSVEAQWTPASELRKA